MIKQGVREIFDNISLSVISFLENHIGISDVEFIERQGKLSCNSLSFAEFAWVSILKSFLVLM